MREVVEVGRGPGRGTRARTGSGVGSTVFPRNGSRALDLVGTGGEAVPVVEGHRARLGDLNSVLHQPEPSHCWAEWVRKVGKTEAVSS